jgi:hypothetical protein
MTLTLPDGQPFATGATAYHYRPATAQETTPRLVLEVAIDGIVTHAMVDTGGLYLVCYPGLAPELHLEPAEAISGPRTLLFRGVLVQGHLYRLTLALLAQAGDDLTVQATAFVPEPQEEESWSDLSSILGFYGCLERVRFAVDLRTETFFFGPA